MPKKHVRAKAVITPVVVADDFKRIKGIGPAKEKRLHAAGIYTYADLAKLTSAQVADRTGGLSAKIVAKQRWIKQAARLAPESAHRPLHLARFRIDLRLDDNDRVQYTRVKHVKDEKDEVEPLNWDDGWHYWSEEKLINFFVQHAGIEPQMNRAPPLAARTESTIEKKSVHTQESEAVHKITSDQLLNESQLPAEASTSVSSAGTPVETNIQAIQPTERALESTVEPKPAKIQVPIQLAAEAAAQAPSAVTSVETSPKLQLAASDMRIFDSPIQSLTTESSSVKRLRAQFSFQLSGAKANEFTTAQLSYFVQTLACELATGHMTVLATDKQMLQPGSMLYAPTADFVLPEVGRYQTFGVLFISTPDDDSIPDRNRVDVACGPILNIIP
jgi:hypothetical protein